MKRKVQNLKRSRQRLASAIDLLTVELKLLDQQIDGLEGKSKLDAAFFWRDIIPLIAERGGALTSAQMHSELSVSGKVTPIGNLRVFLSRQRKRGLLQLETDKNGRQIWRITMKAAEMAYEMGLKVPEKE